MIDFHIHSNASDGTDPPEILLKKLKSSGIKFFSLTDHDTINGALKIKEIVDDEIKFIKGIEFSCISENGKCHILGLNYDENNADFQNALKTGDKLRHEKFFRRIEILHDKFNINFSQDEIDDLLKNTSVGKIHLANSIVNKGLAENRAEAMSLYLDKLKTPNDKIKAETAVKAILSSGGIPVWAHPLGGEGDPDLPEIKFFEILNELISYGLKGLECYYSKYEIKRCEWLSSIAEKYSLFVSGGSDYHGAHKNIPLGKLNAENIKIDEKFITILENF